MIVDDLPRSEDDFDKPELKDEDVFDININEKENDKYINFEPTGGEPVCPACGFMLNSENEIWCPFCVYNVLLDYECEEDIDL